jgi:hypothetical protein
MNSFRKIFKKIWLVLEWIGLIGMAMISYGLFKNWLVNDSGVDSFLGGIGWAYVFFHHVKSIFKKTWKKR